MEKNSPDEKPKSTPSKSRAAHKPIKIKHLSVDEIDPNGPGEGDGIFGLPFTPENSSLVLIPVPFEATTSYGGGTAQGPQNILKASDQVDLYHEQFPDAWKKGVCLLSENRNLKRLNKEAKISAIKRRKAKAAKLIAFHLENANRLTGQMNDFVETETKKYLDQNKLVGVVGGDHSSPFGAIKALMAREPEMGILHFDAHFDLRKAYEGFEWSHASIMYNVMTKLQPKKLVQVGIRDFCDEEWKFAQKSSQIEHFLDSYLFAEKAKGTTWDDLAKQIIEALPEKVYVSFDIDGLDPNFCPTTGTPVPGGLSYNEAVYILRKLVESGRKIVGFDLNEVGPGEWDGNVGARILYELSMMSLGPEN